MAIRDIEIYIIQPKAATNLVTNPNFATVTTGYTAVGGSSSIARTATNGYQRRGAYGLDITPTANAESGVYFGTVALTSGTTYTFSCDVKDVAGQTFSINIVAADADPSGTAVTWTGDGYWKRKAVTWACTSSENYRLYLTRSSVNSTTHFYTDGWQLEVGAESTYFDGDMSGYHRGRTDFYWTGTPYASTSVRTVKTRLGGTLLRLRDYCSITSLMGFGMPNLVNNVSETSGDGSYYQNTRAVDRTVDIGVNFLAGSSPGHSTIAAKRAAIIAAIQPDNVPANEPMRLLFQLEDSSGNPQSDMLALDCLYSAGLEMNLDQHSQILEQAVISFTAYQPFLFVDGNSGASLTVTTTLADTAYLLYRTSAGVWTSAGVVNGAVRALAEDANGYIYAAGDFTSIGGVAANRVAYWDGSAWHAMDTGLAATVHCLAVGPNGYIYAGGAALAPGGATSSVAVWNGAAWAAPMGGGDDPTATVYALTFGPDGKLYIGGSYASASGDTVNGICYWSGSDYFALGSGFASGTVRAIACQGSDVYVGGDAGNVGVQKWDGSTWTDLGCTIDDYVYSLAFDQTGKLYAAGHSTPAAASISIYDVWNGTAWKYGADGTSAGYASTKAVRVVKALPGNNILFGGSIIRFGEPTDMPAANEIVWLRGNIYHYPDMDLTIGGGEYVADMLFKRDRSAWWVGGTWTTTDAVVAGVVSITCTGARSYPIVNFTGPGEIVSLINYTTGAQIDFEDLTLLAGEKATLSLLRGRISFTSTFRGNILRYIKLSSNMDWSLIYGTNSVGLLMTGTTADSAATMYWSPMHWTVDAVAR